MNLTRQHWETLIHCARCGFLARYGVLPNTRSHQRQHDGIWLHWDCNDNHWWASDLTIEELFKAGYLARDGENAVDITTAGRAALEIATPHYREPEDPLLAKLDEFYANKFSPGQVASNVNIAATLPPGVERKEDEHRKSD